MIVDISRTCQVFASQVKRKGGGTWKFKPPSCLCSVILDIIHCSYENLAAFISFYPFSPLIWDFSRRHSGNPACTPRCFDTSIQKHCLRRFWRNERPPHLGLHIYCRDIYWLHCPSWVYSAVAQFIWVHKAPLQVLWCPRTCWGDPPGLHQQSHFFSGVWCLSGESWK